MVVMCVDGNPLRFISLRGVSGWYQSTTSSWVSLFSVSRVLVTLSAIVIAVAVVVAMEALARKQTFR